MRLLTIALACLFALGVAGTAAAQPGGPEKIVRLDINEEAGFSRVNEPITMGVPLPEGKVDNAAKIVLLDGAGLPIPCQVTEVARWLDGKSVKWVQLTWLETLNAKTGRDIYVAMADAPQPPAATKLSAVLKDNVVTVQTGLVKFVVRGAKFNGLDGAWFDPTGQNKFDDANKVITGDVTSGSTVRSPDNSQVSVADLKFKVDGWPKVYASTNDPDGKVAIEEQGPRRVVVKATGRHLDEKGNRALDYIVRFYAYADSPIVRVSHTFVNAQGSKPADLVFMSGLSFDLWTTLAGGKLTIGSEADPLTTNAPAGGISQLTSDAFEITGGEKAVNGKGKSTKPLTTGWLDVAKDKVGLAVGVKWFWQMFPKAVEFPGKGDIRMTLYPENAAQPLEVYMGQSRTHYMTLVFHDDKTDAKQLNAIFAAQNRPLFAWASPKYYCRDTHAFGYSVEADAKLFGDKGDAAGKHDAALLDTLKAGLKAVDSRSRANESHESYGVYEWGDMYHWNWRNKDGSPDWGKSPFHTDKWRLSWEGNYYDYPNVMLMGFVRTGEKSFLDRFIPNAIQVGDVHTCNYHPDSKLIGGCHYCPPRNFVAQDEGNVYVSPEFNHFKSQCVYAYYYLTGDLRVRECAMMQANNALNNHEADSGWAARGVGAQLAGLWNAYELTRDAKYLARMKDMAYRAMAQFKTGKYRVGDSFMWGIANEGLCYYYWVTGDQAVIDTLKEGYLKCKAATSYANMALGSAMVYRVTGDEQFRDLAWKAIGKERSTIGAHEAGQTFRSTHFALYFLSDASKDWKPFKQDVK